MMLPQADPRRAAGDLVQWYVDMGVDAALDDLPRNRLAEAREAFEKRVVTRVLGEMKGNVSRTAERLGLDRTTLHRKLKGYGLEDEKE